MRNWQRPLRYDPIPPLVSSTDKALEYFVKRDLLDGNVGPIDQVWQLPEARRMVKKQQADGSWKYPGKKTAVYPEYHYSLVETWKQFRFLVEQYEFNKEHPATRKASEFLFSCQTEDGDIRGMIGNQYATYYTGAIMSLLTKAGYGDDPRIEKGFRWLLSMRQNDGGWTVPLITIGEGLARDEMIRLTSQYAEPLEPDRSRPFSHNWTGMVLRAFAAHEVYRNSEAARTAASLLKTRFFKEDVYSSYRDANHWVRFQYPFWWNNLVAALDSISLIGLSKDDEDVQNALNWLIENQEESGLWRLSYSEIHKATENQRTREMQLWVSLAICRIFKRFYER